jgi:hypothetical protein
MAFTKILGPGIATDTNVQVGILTATKYFGDGSSLTGILNNTISTPINTTSPQFIGFSSVSSGVNTSIGISSTFVFIPSSGNLGIGTTNPTSKLTITGDVLVSGVITATTFVGALTGTASSTTNIPNLTGAITSVNTTTSLGSFTSAQLATSLTDETGSGSAVFATSPTLVTPVLGNATASSLNVSGISTFTNGPILVGTATSTGTSSQPLQVTGGAYVSGSIGIGTINPTARLNLYDTAGSAAWRFRIGTNVSDGAGFYQRANGDFEMVLRDASNNNNYILGSSGNLSLRPTSNVLINTDTPTGTSSQPLQVTGGAYVSGNLGVGVINPTQTLHVQGSARVTGAVYDFNNAAGSTGQILQSVGTGVSWTTLSGGATLTNDTTTNASYYPTFSSATSGTYSTAYVSNTKCTFNPSTGTLSATQFTSLSDANKKKNIRPIENAIEITKKLEGVRFDWKDNDAPSIGVIAQEVEKVLPELVIENDGIKSVSYGNIVGVLIEAIKEQQVRIEELERKLNA